MNARLLVLDVINGSGFSETICNDIDDLHKALCCDYFDIVSRRIEDTYFDIFVDDMGLFADNSRVSAVDEDMRPMLVGNLIFAHHDSEGETTSVSDKDIELIKSHSINIIDFDNSATFWKAVSISY